jgi:hypothetical protein
MRIRLLSTFVALALWVSSSYAGLDLTWNDCVNESTVQDLNFTNCGAALRTFRLYASFKVPVVVPNFIAADLTFDIEDQTAPSLPPFWRFDDSASGGCNAAGLAVRLDAESDGICSSEINPWGFAGNQAIPYSYYVAGANYPCRGRLYVSIARDSHDPFPLESGINYYMCHLALNTSQRASCAGCGDKVGIVWNSALLYENNGNAYTITGPDKLGNCATVNHAVGYCKVDECFPPPCPPPCATPVAAMKWSWGQLKSIYR